MLWLPQHLRTFDSGQESGGVRSSTRMRVLGGGIAVFVVAGLALTIRTTLEEAGPALGTPLSPIDPMTMPNPNNPGFDYRGNPLPAWLQPSPIDADATLMQGESETSLREDVRESQDLKEKAQELDVKLQGRTPEVFKKELVPELEARIGSYLAQFGTDFDRMVAARFPGYAQNPEMLYELKEAFQSTLEKRVKLFSAVTGISYQEIARDPRLLDQLSRQAYFDFAQSLKASHDSGVTYKIAMKLAGLTHWLEPRVIATLEHKYGSSVDPNVIKYAVLGYSKSPDAFLDSYLHQVSRLTNTYGSSVDPNVIKHAATHHPGSPEAFIDSYLHQVSRLTNKYGTSVEPGVIKHAALSYPKPDTFLDSYLHQVSRLTNKYGSSVDLSIIKVAALYYPSSPDTFISWYLYSYGELMRTPGAKPYIVDNLLRRNQMLPIEELRKLI